ncbi:MAG: hypothetical protein NXI31_12325 [bacterium]|nr:hypothetical protein [bacterium]
MILATSLFSLSALLPAPQGDLKLPPRKQDPATQQNVPRPMTEIERFRRDVEDLVASPARLEQKLQEFGLRYPALDALIIEVARAARSREMTALMPVARRYGSPEVARELRFQLLARPLGKATRPVVDAMTYLMGPERDGQDQLDERQALYDVIRSRQSSARRAATEALAEIAAPDDLPFALELASQQSLDLQLRGVDLLRSVADAAARQRLIALLSKPPALAGAACRSLIALGQKAVPELQALLAEPPIDRGYCYAAFALAQIGGAEGRLLIDPAATRRLLLRLDEREALTRSLAAIALADLAYHASPAAGGDDGASGGAAGAAAHVDDTAVGDALLDLVDSRLFVPNLDLLRRPAEERLVRMTGRVVRPDAALSWRDWWTARREGFVGIREHVAITAENAHLAVVTLRAERQTYRLLAEGLGSVAPLEESEEAFLTKEDMLALVRDLERAGFGDSERMRHKTSLPIVRSLEVQVAGARALVGMPAIEHRPFARLEDRIARAIDGQLWQLYRHPVKEPDRAAFWRAERRWLDSHTDPIERGRRFGRRVIANWSVLTPWLRGRALEHLFARADRKQLFDEADGDAVLALVRQTPALGALELRMLELAAGIPGDRVWRECIDVAARVEGGGRDAVRAVFAVLGPEAILAALNDERAVVRRVAVDEAVRARDVRSGPRLVELLASSEEPVPVRRAAADAVGQLRLVAAREPLVGMIVDSATDPLVRRASLVALGRVGGDNAYSVLDQALRAPVPADREAALRGLGELRDPRAAHTLAELAVIAHGSDQGGLAKLYLGRMGARLAVPAIRHQVKVVQDPEIHDELVLLLGSYQDAESVPDLLQLLRNPRRAADAKIAIMGTTGVDLSDTDDPWGLADEWWRRNRARPQWQWLLDGLSAAEAPTLLRAEQFAPGAGTAAIPELARLLTDLREPRLYVLASAVLRSVSGEDYGVVAMHATPENRAGIAARYRLLFETRNAAKNR